MRGSITGAVFHKRGIFALSCIGDMHMLFYFLFSNGDSKYSVSLKEEIKIDKLPHDLQLNQIIGV